MSAGVEELTDCRIYAHLVSYTCCRALYEAEDRRFGANDGDVERLRVSLVGRYLPVPKGTVTITLQDI